MIPPKAKEILGLVVSICSIVSCIVAVYGVFQVVNFVVDVRPIVVPIAQEVKEGNMDLRKLLSSTITRHDTVRLIERDTIYIQKGKEGDERDFPKHRRVTVEDEKRIDKSAEYVSEQKRQEIDEAESSFRQRMREKMR